VKVKLKGGESENFDKADWLAREDRLACNRLTMSSQGLVIVCVFVFLVTQGTAKITEIECGSGKSSSLQRIADVKESVIRTRKVSKKGQSRF